MLQSLHISNYALISQLDIDFGRGLNIITGETGAGKSIILGALGLLMGGRADGRVVTDKDNKSVVEGAFGLSDVDTPALQAIFKERDLDWDNDTLTLRREISHKSTRSRAFVNDTPTSVEALAQIAAYLIDIHSQHQNQLLATPAYQMSVLDALADNALYLENYRNAYSLFQEARRDYDRARRDAEADAAEKDFLQSQYDRIAALHLKEGEQLALEEERTVLANAADILETHQQLSSGLEGEENGVLRALGNAISQCQRLAKTLPATAVLVDRLQEVDAEVKDIINTLNAAAARVSADPARQAAVEERLEDIYELLRRHKADNSDQLILISQELQHRLQGIEVGDILVAEAHKTAQMMHKNALAAARSLSEARRKAAKTFAQDLVAAAAPLGMANIQCDIHIDTLRQLSPTGIDEVEMRLAFNKGQTPMALSATASGGEVSRLMLSVKSLIAAHMRIPTIIFDEVDTGVSGDIAGRMGQMMYDIARNIQVIAITHLPQVAALGDTHFKVYKRDNDQATVTHIKALTEQERIDELATMLSGDPEAQHARLTAQALLARRSGV